MAVNQHLATLDALTSSVLNAELLVRTACDTDGNDREVFLILAMEQLSAAVAAIKASAKERGQ